MITLRDSIEIETTLDNLFNWFKDLEKNFSKWHPNHKKFQKVTGGDDVGDIIYFEQCVGGIWYKIKGKITAREKSTTSFRLEFKTMSGIGKISFIAKATKEGCIFTHNETFGLEAPLIGGPINFLIFKIIARKKANWDLILQDMKEDNENLKKIMENARAQQQGGHTEGNGMGSTS
jgi:hypothetical protein